MLTRLRTEEIQTSGSKIWCTWVALPYHMHQSHNSNKYACFATEIIECHSSTHSLLHEDQLWQCFSMFQHQFSFIDQRNAPSNVIWHLKNVQESNQILLYLPILYPICIYYTLNTGYSAEILIHWPPEPKTWRSHYSKPLHATTNRYLQYILKSLIIWFTRLQLKSSQSELRKKTALMGATYLEKVYPRDHSISPKCI